MAKGTDSVQLNERWLEVAQTVRAHNVSHTQF